MISNLFSHLQFIYSYFAHRLGQGAAAWKPHPSQDLLVCYCCVGLRRATESVCQTEEGSRAASGHVSVVQEGLSAFF